MSRDDDRMRDRTLDHGHDDVLDAEEFADVRAALGLAVPPVQPSPALKQSLMAAIAVTPQLPAEPADAAGPAAGPATAVAAPADPAGPAAARAQARWFSRPAMLVVAAAAAVALFVGGVLSADLVRPSAPSAADQLATIVAAADVTTVVSPVAGGATATLVASESVGLSAMVFDGLAPLPADKRYALWYITDGVPTPAGLFAVDGEGAVVQVLEGTFEAGAVVGVTVEPASGSPAPTSDPIVAIATA